MTEEELKAKVKDLRMLLFADEYDEHGECLADSLALTIADTALDYYLTTRRPAMIRDFKTGKLKEGCHDVTLSEQLEEIIEVLWKIYNAM